MDAEAVRDRAQLDPERVLGVYTHLSVLGGWPGRYVQRAPDRARSTDSAFLAAANFVVWALHTVLLLSNWRHRPRPRIGSRRRERRPLPRSCLGWTCAARSRR